MSNLARGRTAVTSLVLSIAALAVLVLPAAALADDPLPGFAPAPVDFPKTTVGTESQSQMVDVTNVGASGVSVESVVFDGGDSGEFKFNGHSCNWLEPGQHCQVWVTFFPSGVGAKASTLAVKLKEAPEQTVALSGEAVAPQLSFSPPSHDFGIQRVNRGEGSANFQLTNDGEAATQINGVGIGGQNPNNFWTNGDCWGGRWLQPGESCNVGVGFNPWDLVLYSAELQVGSSGSSFTATLSGHGGRSIIEAGESRTEFGSAEVGGPGTVREVVFTNHGNMETAFFIAVIASGSIASFELLDEDCTGLPLAPGQSCTVEVRFDPRGAGPKLARVALFGNDDGGAMAELNGVGLEPVAETPAVPGVPDAASAAAPAAASAAAPPAHRAKKRRFARGKTLHSGQARCYALKCRRR